MSIKIHHGPPGSYKTAGAVTDDLIPAIKSGRPIVTNLRGFSLEKVEEALGDIPEGLEIHHIDTTTREGREKLGTFFHWVPHGAFLFIDEAQAIFPKRWREAELRAMDLDFDQAKAENRPQNWWDAWDMHRHYNWDFILTTPDISKIRDDIRDASELAYKHKNLGLYGLIFKGSYIEGIHSKDTDGNNKSNFQSVKQKRVSKHATTWKLYESTATGDIKETLAGFNLFSNPRLVIGFAVLGYVGYSIAARGGDLVQLPSDQMGIPPTASVAEIPASPRPAESGSIPAALPGAVEAAAPAPLTHPLQGHTIHYTGHYTIGSSHRVVQHEPVHMFHDIHQGKVLNQYELVAMGYTVQQHSDCLYSLTHAHGTLYAQCNYS